jgi:sterol desaturase/sphingolipid hydroxylase (fatty acid hydroxylase superfamily)
LSGWIEPVLTRAEALTYQFGVMAWCAVFFGLLALLLKGRAAIGDARAAAGQARINLTMTLLSRMAVGPLIALFALGVVEFLKAHGLNLAPVRLWHAIGQWPTLLLAILAGDFIGYWRHRAQHSRWLWPAHAVHHSDTHLTWLSLERMHPVDQLGTAMDSVLLIALGFPAEAIAGNMLVRHYYGYVIHADIPWTLGKAGMILNSPVMHRWHHARDVDGAGHNFATVFSIWDRMFGSYYQPGPCAAPLGVREAMGEGAVGQYLHPLKAWAGALRNALRPPLPRESTRS